MKIIYNNIIPFPGFSAMNLFGIIFARKSAKPLKDSTIRHEAIHTAQMKDLLYIFFYLIYVLEWFVRLFMKGNAYRNILFEKEAYDNQGYPDYLKTRRWCEQWRKHPEA